MTKLKWNYKNTNLAKQKPTENCYPNNTTVYPSKASYNALILQTNYLIRGGKMFTYNESTQINIEIRTIPLTQNKGQGQ